MEKKKNLFTMDLKDIGKKGEKARPGGKYPSKTHLNLAVKQKTINSPSRAIPVFLLLLLAILAFSKFGVSDKLAAVDKATAAAEQSEQKLAQMKELTADYEAVKAEYDRRVFHELDLYTGTIDAMDLLALIEDKLIKNASVSNFSAQEPVVNVKLSGVTLSEMSQLVRILEENPMVNDVMVYQANSIVATPTPTPEPTPTPAPTKTPRPTRTPKGQTPTPVPTLTPTPAPTTPLQDMPASFTITITLKSVNLPGGEE